MLMPVALTACAAATADLTQLEALVFFASTAPGSLFTANKAPSLAAFTTRAGSWSPKTPTVWMRSHGYFSHAPL